MRFRFSDLPLGHRMRRNQLKELAANPNFISGIYNYCDRWCERCAFTSRCMLFATEQADEELNDPETRDLNNQKFWLKLSRIFQSTAEMIEEDAKKAGIDLGSVDVSAEMAQHEQALEAAHQHDISQAAATYAKSVHDWFRQEFSTEAEAARSSLKADAEVDLSAAAEVIRWYQFFIQVKLIRALSGAHGIDEEDFDEQDLLCSDFTSTAGGDDQMEFDKAEAKSSLIDSNGSAKIALVAIDRSLAAWSALLASLPEKSQSIRPMLIHLERLRRSAEARFPHARDFIRPGLDELHTEFEN